MSAPVHYMTGTLTGAGQVAPCGGVWRCPQEGGRISVQPSDGFFSQANSELRPIRAIHNATSRTLASSHLQCVAGQELLHVAWHHMSFTVVMIV
jgi:hypothetical protein